MPHTRNQTHTTFQLPTHNLTQFQAHSHTFTKQAAAVCLLLAFFFSPTSPFCAYAYAVPIAMAMRSSVMHSWPSDAPETGHTRCAMISSICLLLAHKPGNHRPVVQLLIVCTLSETRQQNIPYLAHAHQVVIMYQDNAVAMQMPCVIVLCHAPELTRIPTRPLGVRAYFNCYCSNVCYCSGYTHRIDSCIIHPLLLLAVLPCNTEATWPIPVSVKVVDQ